MLLDTFDSSITLENCYDISLHFDLGLDDINGISYDLKITIEVNKTIVNVLDVTLDCRAANTIHTQRKVTFHCTCTRNPITHHLS